MRLAIPQERLDCLPISEVKLNLNCRDEIIPILRALQHVYGDAPSRRELLGLVGKDVNQGTSRKRGRRGLNYWEVTVLAATRLGCNLDYDKLQDLAENHRSLQQIMGIGAWEAEEVDKQKRHALSGTRSRYIWRDSRPPDGAAWPKSSMQLPGYSDTLMRLR